MGYMLGIDVGTTTCKAMVTDEEGKVIAYEESEAYSVLRPKPGWAEQNPREWWNAVKSIVKSIVSKVGGENIASISVSSMEEGVVPIDRDGKPLYNCMIWQDSRTKPQEKWVMKNVGFIKVLEITGLPPAYVWSAEKVLWLKENAKEVFNKTYKFLQPKDYINYMLTGELTTDWSIAGHTQLFDISKREWSEELMEAHGIPLDKWPEVYPSAKVIGEVRGEVAEELGLKKHIPVMAGGGDQEVSTLGAGAISGGEVSYSAGTSNILNICISKPVFDPRVTVFCHPHEKLWIIELYPTQLGEALQWMSLNLWSSRGETSVYREMDLEAEKSPIGANGLFFYPYFRGKYSSEINENMRASIVGLTFNHSRGDVIRALMEGSAYEVRDIVEFCERKFGINIKKLVVSGGVSKSPVWREIMANVLSRNLILPQVKDTTLLGNTILASIGAKHYRSLEEAVSKMFKEAEIVEPNEKMSEKYRKLYFEYKKHYRSLERIFRKPFIETSMVLEVLSLYIKLRKMFRK